MQYTILVLSARVCNELNGSSRKYIGGQSQDQSLFEDSVMWAENETESLLSILTRLVGS